MSSSNDTLTPEELRLAQYGYVPTRWICYMFITLFGISTISHVIETFLFKPRLYWILPTIVMCGIGELIGWGGRLWSSINPPLHNSFLMQLCTTIIAPTFLTAALYTIFGTIIIPLGTQYSRLRPKTYIIVFVTADVVALVVQAAGGGIAATANDSKTLKLGSNIMVAGIFLQLAGLTLFTFLATEYLLRFHLQKPLRLAPDSTQPVPTGIQANTPLPEKSWIRNAKGEWDGRGTLSPRVSLMVLALALATLFVFIRTIYRSIELLGGWHGHIIRTEVFFDVLDGTPILIAMYVFNILPPGLLLQNM